MGEESSAPVDPRDAPLMPLLRAIAARDTPNAIRLLTAAPELATHAVQAGAMRKGSPAYFLAEIPHHTYAGDTALHLAAAAHLAEVAEALLARGASVGAANRRQARPLHYAADGSPGAAIWNPEGQAATISRLLRAGADPNAPDMNGVAPLHRAVRTRCAAAVQALLSGGADPLRKNGSGSTPLHLAVQTTGRGGSGTDPAREQQEEIIRLLLQHGARITDMDGNGKTVMESCTNDRLRKLLAGPNVVKPASRHT